MEIQKSEYLESEKSPQDEIKKSNLTAPERPSPGEKQKPVKKLETQALKNMQ